MPPGRVSRESIRRLLARNGLKPMHADHMGHREGIFLRQRSDTVVSVSVDIVKYSHLFTSCDSQSWSRWARWDRIKWDGCTADHADCRNCLAWAQAWRAQTLANAGQRDDYDDRGLLQYPWWPRREWPDAA
jgi:hypothetical protein